MEDQKIADKIPVGEQVSENFICPICLEILYKPIVLCCGHVACFWCVHKSMDRFRKSHCPICRHPYVHFPFMCEMFHSLLLKIYPIAYKRRGDQILEEEKIIGCFSPQFDGLNHLVNEAFLAGSQSKVCLDSQLSNEKESCADIKQSESRRSLIDNILEKGPDRKLALKLKDDVNARHKITVDDVSCLSCKQVLFRPVVLNCGHVYCEVCTMKPTEVVLRCQVCGSIHPRRFPKVCLELDNFLKEQFSKYYAARADDVNRVVLSLQNSTSCSSNAEQGGLRLSCGSTGGPSPRGDNNMMIHSGIGCDSCGMYPITGDRYKCKDCVERMGFDLCGDCYHTRSKLPGRFNQQHTPDHKFEHVKVNSLRERMLALVTGLLDRATAAAVFPTNPTDSPPLDSSPLTVEFPYADVMNHADVFASLIPPSVAEENGARGNESSSDSPSDAEDA